MATARDADEMAHAETLPQADATSLVDAERLEGEVKEMYRHVAREEDAELHFEVGRGLASHLGYPETLLDAIPPEALASFAGVGYHLDLAALASGEDVLDLGSGSGTDAFCAAVQVGRAGRVVGVDFTDEQVAKASRLAERDGFGQAAFHEASIDELPLTDTSFDVVISNGVINLSPVKHRVFREAARVLRPGGRLVVADIVSGKPLKERTRRNVAVHLLDLALEPLSVNEGSRVRLGQRFGVGHFVGITCCCHLALLVGAAAPALLRLTGDGHQSHACLIEIGRMRRLLNQATARRIKQLHRRICPKS